MEKTYIYMEKICLYLYLYFYMKKISVYNLYFKSYI